MFYRLRGNYEALKGGKLHDALVDMTGGLGELILINNKSEIPDNLYDLMWKCSQMNSMLGASIHVSLLEHSYKEGNYPVIFFFSFVFCKWNHILLKLFRIVFLRGL